MRSYSTDSQNRRCCDSNERNSVQQRGKLRADRGISRTRKNRPRPGQRRFPKTLGEEVRPRPKAPETRPEERWSKIIMYGVPGTPFLSFHPEMVRYLQGAPLHGGGWLARMSMGPEPRRGWRTSRVTNNWLRILLLLTSIHSVALLRYSHLFMQYSFLSNIEDHSRL